MELGEISQISRETLYTLIVVSSPILITALVIGLIISLLQALTQIQENTLTFIPKIFGIYLGLLVFMPYSLGKLQLFVDHIVQKIIGS